ncbi:MAG: FecR domain-containing protein [Mariniphaga sp.]
MISPNYNLYTADDFILDEEFRDIVREVGSTNRLNLLLESFPHKRAEINLAIQVISGLKVGKFQQPTLKKHESLQIIHRSQKLEVRRLYLKIAASLLLLIGIGSAITYELKPNHIDEVAMVINEAPSNNSTLILANGKTVSITSRQSKIQCSADGTGIIVNDSSSIAQAGSRDGLNQLIVPFGKRAYLLLSDGSRVWLNSGSKLTFPPAFKGLTREVYLDGEALFEVAKNAGKPFYVKTEFFQTKVYGTKFNIQAYKQDDNFSIVLVEGKISLNSNEQLKAPEVFLVPNQRATISKETKTFEITNVENTAFYTAWVEGYLTFNNEKVSNVLKRVSRYYNVIIDAENLTKVETIYGKLDLKDNQERVLDGISFISKTKYVKQGNKYVFLNN